MDEILKEVTGQTLGLKFITEEEYAAIMSQVKDACDIVVSFDIHPTSFEIETEPTTENNGLIGKLFGDNVKGSNVALVAITGLTVLIVGFLIAYLVLLRKKK